MPILEEIHELIFIPILHMTGPTERHEVTDLILFFAASHPPGIDVMNVYRGVITDLTRDPVGYVVSKGFKVDLCMWFHLFKLNFRV